VVIAGLITLALVGMVQSLGALVEPLPVEVTWRSDAAGEDERGQTTGRGPASRAAIGAAAPSPPRRGEPTLSALDDTTAPAFSVLLRSQESRAPPALLTHSI